MAKPQAPVPISEPAPPTVLAGPPDSAPSMDIDDLLGALASASQAQERQDSVIAKLAHVAVDAAARLYILEMAMGLRPSGALGPEGLRFTSGASRATYANVYRRIREELLGLGDGSGATTA